MRVLAVGNMYPPHHLGGYELVWRAAVRHLEAHGHEVRVLTSDHRQPGVTDADDGDVHRELEWWWRDHDFPRRTLAERRRLVRASHAVLRRHLAAFRPQVVSWWSMGGMTQTLIEDVRRRGLPAVAFVHDDWLVYGPLVDQWLRIFRTRPWLRPLGALAAGVPAEVDLGRAARYLFVSETTRRHALAARPELADTGVAHSGIDPSFLDPRPPREWRWRLLYVGRIDERKGIATAVEALAALPREATLTIVGDGDPAAEQALRARAAALGVAERIVRRGGVARGELPGIYEDADVVVFPVLWDEPWGLVPLEAMALGRPVVATGRGGSGEYLRDGENALLHPAGDAQALAESLRALAADAGLRERLRQGGAATAPQYTEEAFNRAVVAELERAAGAPRQEPGGRSSV